VLLIETTRDDDLEIGASVLQVFEMSQGSVEPVVGVLTDAAGVEDDLIGLVDRFGGGHPVGVELSGDPLGVVPVNLTAERADVIARRVGTDRGVGHGLSSLWPDLLRPPISRG